MQRVIMARRIFILIFFLIPTFILSQSVQLLQSGMKTSIRGMSVVTNLVIWVSGSNGTIGKSTDGGNTWQWNIVDGFEKRDFRDIYAFDSNTAIIMAVAEPAHILKTVDGGKNWKVVFTDTTKGMFLDAMDFSDTFGVVIGDPVNGKFFRAYTTDAGETWQKQDMRADAYTSFEGEAFFAASGTNIKVVPDKVIKMAGLLMVSGGKRSRLFINEESKDLPLSAGKETTGANSIDYFNKRAAIVGGDFASDTLQTGNCVLLKFDKKKIDFKTPDIPPHGYRSCVIYVSKNRLVACGTSGVDISNDGGNRWQLISKEDFHVCQKARSGKTVFLAGSNGRIARLIF